MGYEGFWPTYRKALLVWAVCAAGLWGGRADRLDPTTIQAAFGAWIIMSILTIPALLLYGLLARRKARQEAE